MSATLADQVGRLFESGAFEQDWAVAYRAIGGAIAAQAFNPEGHIDSLLLARSASMLLQLAAHGADADQFVHVARGLLDAEEFAHELAHTHSPSSSAGPADQDALLRLLDRVTGAHFGGPVAVDRLQQSFGSVERPDELLATVGRAILAEAPRGSGRPATRMLVQASELLLRLVAADVSIAAKHHGAAMYVWQGADNAARALCRLDGVAANTQECSAASPSRRRPSC